MDNGSYSVSTASQPARQLPSVRSQQEEHSKKKNAWLERETFSDGSTSHRRSGMNGSLDSGESGMITSENDSSGDDSNSSEERYERFLSKYRKYLDDETKATNTTSSVDSNRQEDNYEKYRKSLARAKEEQDRWVTPEKKLGAPPTLEISYQHSTPPSPMVNTPQPVIKPTQEKAPKLESNVLGEEDLAIVKMMLGADSDSDIDSLPSAEVKEHIFVDTPSSGGTNGLGKVGEENNRDGHSGVSGGDEIELVAVGGDMDGPEDRVLQFDEISETKKEPVDIMDVIKRDLAAGGMEEDLPTIESIKNDVSSQNGNQNEARVSPVLPVEGEEQFRDMPDKRNETVSTAPTHDSDGRDFDALWEKSGDSDFATEDLGRVNLNHDDSLSMASSPQSNAKDESDERLRPQRSTSPQELVRRVSSGSSSNPEEAVQGRDSSASSHDKEEPTTEKSTQSDKHSTSGILETGSLTAASVDCEVQDLESGQMGYGGIPISDHESSSSGSVSGNEKQQLPQLQGRIDENFVASSPTSQIEQVQPDHASAQGTTESEESARTSVLEHSAPGIINIGEGRQSPVMVNEEDEFLEDSKSSRFEDAADPQVAHSQSENTTRRTSEGLGAIVAIEHNHDDDTSVGGYSLPASEEFDEILAEGELINLEYEPQRENYHEQQERQDSASEQPPHDLDDPSGDIEVAVKRSAQRSKKPMHQNERGGFLQCVGKGLILLISFTISCAPFYFLFADSGGSNAKKTPANGQLDAPPPLASPTVPPPSTANPTADPVRESLINVWPSLEEQFYNLLSPQYLAFQWLSGNANLESYTVKKQIQRFALATFYFSTNGDKWKQNDSWLTEEDECSWYSSNTFRSQCNGEGQYRNLELTFNGLSGTIPPELALLSDSLSLIDITQDKDTPNSVIAGQIPPEFGALTLLESVSFGHNQLSGSLPSEIGSWSRATLLDLKHNAFTGEMPSEIGLLVALSSLNLERNWLIAIPSEIGNLRLLRDLDLSRNKFQLVPSEIGNLLVLRTLSLANNGIQGSIPSEIGLLADLIRLELGNNLIRGSIPTEIGNLLAIRGKLSS